MRIMYVALGSIALGLGVLGIFLPVLPTTPFLLLAAALYCKGSPRLYRWLLESKHLGPYIRNFREQRAIPLRVKVISISMMWATIVLSAFLAVNVWWLRVLLFAVAAAVTWHILSFRTLRN
jgi:uncharacterized membrane protein YbaN (DUF454 family)